MLRFPPLLRRASRVDAVTGVSRAKVCVLCVAGWSLGGVAGVVLLARVFLCDVVACLLTLPFDTRIYERVLRAITS